MIAPGQRFGRWVVLSTPTRTRSDCACDCGTKRAVRSCDLLAGRSKSCGCSTLEISAARFTSHGLCAKDKPLLDVYRAMVRRCCDPKNRSFKDYGGRGITVCERWLTSPAAFFEDMSPRPPGMEIDRIDNDAGYSPENCRWVSRKQNTRNRRTTTQLTHNNETLSLGEWAERTGVSPKLISYRIQAGWGTEKALFTPVASGNRWLSKKGD